MMLRSIWKLSNVAFKSLISHSVAVLLKQSRFCGGGVWIRTVMLRKEKAAGEEETQDEMNGPRKRSRRLSLRGGAGP